MKRSHLLLYGTWLIHTAAWFLPVIKGGVQFSHGLPGWHAWQVWPREGSRSSFATWYEAVLVTVTAVSNLLFVLGSPRVIWRGSHSLRLASA